VITVCADRRVVEAQLASRVLVCPVEGCGGRLRGNGKGVERTVFTGLTGRGVGGVRFAPCRAKCVGCGVTQVCLPAGLLSRRMDSAGVVAVVVEAVAGGMGSRRAAGLVGRPESTVRGWVRAAREVCGWGVGLAARLSVGLLRDPAGVGVVGVGGLSGLVAGWGALASGLAMRWRQPVAGWLAVAAAACRCRVLQTGWRPPTSPRLPDLGVFGEGLILGGQGAREPP